jgi:hypothetical protein
MRRVRRRWDVQATRGFCSGLSSMTDSKPSVRESLKPLEPSVPTSKPSVRKRVPWFSLIGIVLLVLLTIGNAAANMIPFHVPTTYERQQAEQNEIIEARRARLSVLLAEGDRCRPYVAHEIARTLVFDGRSARTYAANYQLRCGIDPVVERWGNAPMPRRKA